MTRVLLFLLFFVLLAADALELNLSLAPGLSVKNAFLYLIVAGIAVDTALKRNRRLEFASVIVPYSLYVFYAIFTIVIIVLFLQYPNYKILYSIISLKGGVVDNLLVFLVFFYGVLTAKEATWLIKAMIWTVIFANSITVVDGFNIPDLGLVNERLDGRIGGPIGESNQYAAFLAIFLPAAVALVAIERGSLRALAVFGVLITLVAFLMAASRGGFLGVVGGSLIAAVFLRKFVSLKVTLVTTGAIAVLGVLTLGVVYLGGYGDLLYDRFIGDSTGGNATQISSGRTYIWATALNKMFEHPISLITGFGWDTYLQFRIFRYAPHNSYLKILFELGAIGLVLVLVALFNVLRLARREIRSLDSADEILLLAFVFGMFSLLVAIFFVDIASPWIFFWAYVGTTLRLAACIAASADSKLTRPARHDHHMSAVRYAD
jgi:O-antigen ligase